MINYPELFEPMYIGKCKIKNRTSMAPMGPIGYADAFGGFNQRLQDYYVDRASHDVGLIITGMCCVDMNIEGFSTNSVPSPTTNPLAFIHSTYPMNERIHAYDAKIFLQLTGGLGRSAIPGFAKNNIAPSENTNRFDPSTIHREMTKEEILQLTQSFIKAAVIAKKAGFDGVEIHAVHEGYLLDQFAISIFNRRTDEYGGCLENRLRIATDIVKGIKKVCGSDFPVSIRYSLKSCMKGIRKGGLPGEEYEEAGRDIEEGIEAAKILEAAGYDALNLDVGTYDSWYWNHPPMYFEDGMYREFGEILKKHVNIPIILAGRMDNPEMAVDALDKSCDMVSYGRPLLADNEFVSKIKTGRVDEIRHCLGCHEGCLGRISNACVSCAINPACGRENIYGLTPALIKKKILIIGGGIAGLESARVLSTRGHQVILCEKTDHLGGNLIPGGVPHFKRYDHKLVDYYKKQMELLGVEIHYNTEVTVDNYRDFGADEIITASGSTPRKFNMESEQPIYTADEVLLGKVDTSNEIVMIGGGLVGIETAIWLSQQGKKVTVVEIAKDILCGGAGIPHMNYFMLEDLIKFHKIDVYTSANIQSITADTVNILQNEEKHSIPSKTVIAAVGYKSENKIFEELEKENIIVHNIGDSRKVHNIMYSIWDAYEMARTI